MHCFDSFLLKEMFLDLQEFAFEGQNMTITVNVFLTCLLTCLLTYLLTYLLAYLEKGNFGVYCREYTRQCEIQDGGLLKKNSQPSAH